MRLVPRPVILEVGRSSNIAFTVNLLERKFVVSEDMEEDSKAEQLYFSSVRVRKKLFGPPCSDLKFDYQDLLRIFELTGNHEKKFLRSGGESSPMMMFSFVPDCPSSIQQRNH